MSDIKDAVHPSAIELEQPVPIFPILLVNFIGTLGYSIILPFLIILVIKMGGNEIIYGIIGATYSLFQLIGAPILGSWSDKIGRKRVLLLSQAGTFLAWVLFIIALQLPTTTVFEMSSTISGGITLTIPLLVLFLARALDGITGGNVSVANAYLADLTSETSRKINFGKMSAAGNMGFILGPALAGVLGNTGSGEQLPVLVAMIISLIAIFVIAFMLKDSRSCTITTPLESCKIKKVLGQEHKECYHISTPESVTLNQILHLKDIPFLLLLYFLIFLAFNIFYVAFPVHAVESLQWSLLDLGIFFSSLGMIMVVVQGPLLAKISRKFSDGILTVVGSILLAFSFFCFTSREITIIYFAVALFSTGNGLMWPSFLSILSRVGGSRFQGAIQGYASSMGSLASIIGLITGGYLYGMLGIKTFYLPGLLILIIFALSIRLQKLQTPAQAD